jgi:sulfate transport system ATP-binding protein
VVVMSQGKIEQVGTPDDIYDEPNSPFVFSFIGESSELPVQVEEGKVLFDGSPLNFSAGDCPNGPARMFFRPQDVEAGSEGSGAIQGVIATMRRHGGARRLDVEVGREGHRIEIELPSKFAGSVEGRITVLPRRWRLFPERSANAS